MIMTELATNVGAHKKLYAISRIIDADFLATIARVTEALKREGFGVLTDIDVAATLKQKLGVTFPPYRILGACNPAMAHRALLLEDKIGTMLPCNVIVREAGPGHIEVAAINPHFTMQNVGNPALLDVASDITDRLGRVVASV
jgi:uncharacterized protein (DUF302 family)